MLFSKPLQLQLSTSHACAAPPGPARRPAAALSCPHPWFEPHSHLLPYLHAPNDVIQVTVTHAGVKHELDVPEDRSILEVALDKGIDLPHDCKLGVSW